MLTGSATIVTDWPDPVDENLSARHLPRVRFQLYGMFSGCQSIANVCTQWARVLIRELDGVGLYNYFGARFFDPELEAYEGVNHDAPVGCFYGVPDQVPERFFAHAFTIGGFVCETDRIHPDWVRVCNRMNLVVVPSGFCRDAFLRSGVKSPILVVPHGLEPDYRPLRTKARARPFVFYNTFDSASFPSRKGAEELVRSFLRAFDRDTGVVLRLRTQPTAYMQALDEKYRFLPVIRLDPLLPLTTAEFAAIYSDVHVTVHPSKGEGFGLIPFQSIACETPVIAPAATGMADYLNESNAIPLRTAGFVTGEGVGNQSGHYYAIDEDHLVECMRYAHEHWEHEYDKLRNGLARDFRERHSWANSLRELLGVLRERLGARDTTASSDLLVERYDSKIPVKAPCETRSHSGSDPAFP